MFHLNCSHQLVSITIAMQERNNENKLYKSKITKDFYGILEIQQNVMSLSVQHGLTKL